jgi:hypothetical protein
MPEVNSIQLRFVGGKVNTEALEAEISSILSELADPASEAAKSATDIGLNPADMAGAQVSVAKEAKGFGPVAIVIAIAVPVAAHIVNKFWDDVIWPRIKDKLGADALGKRDAKK